MRRFGLIGKTLGHSFSAKYFNEKFRRENLDDHTYALFELPNIEALPELLAKHDDLVGLNVTIPYKEAVIPFCTSLTDEATAIGAVNCLLLKDNKIIGHNTDAAGFKLSIRPFLEPQHDRALILGTGGAAKAVRYVLKDLGISCAMVSRTNGVLTYEMLSPQLVATCKLIVNCTPVGTFPQVDEMPQIPLETIGKDHFVIDLIYNPEMTKLLQASAERGALILNGTDMLRFQADRAWNFWNE
ncbi:MAG: shikimate dehydrogenase [Cryomorphaceae bacterium]|nr:shikimate dehydrogenase [Cryomorphaceae bacterium]